MPDRLSTHQREPERVQFTLTDRDLEILRKLNQYRYLRTGQIKLLVFPENVTLQSTRRRVRYLYHHKFINRIQPLIRPGDNQTGETAYFLAQEGIKLLESVGETIIPYPHSDSRKHLFLHHALELSDFRIYLNQALDGHPKVELHRFVGDHELKSHLKSKKGNDRFRLYQKLTHPVTNQDYHFHPDGLFILRGKGNLKDHQRLFFIEIDRGTESLDRIRNKVIGYNLFQKSSSFQKFGKFDDFKVLIQTHSDKRARNMREHLVDMHGSELIWITHRSVVNDATIAAEEIWLDHTLSNVSILKPSAPKVPET